MSDTLTDLLSELRARFSPGADVREVEIYLASRGYDARQIGEILAVFVAHLDAVANVQAADAGAAGAGAAKAGAAKAGAADAGAAVRRAEGPTFRVMGVHERSRFAPDAWGQLVALAAAGVITPHDREQLIERALTHTDGRIGVAELRAFLEAAGIDDLGPAGATTIH